MLASLKQLVTVSHSNDNQQLPKGLGSLSETYSNLLDHSCQPEDRGYLFEQIEDYGENILRVFFHVEISPTWRAMCLINLINQIEFGKTFPECSKAAIRVQRASQSRIYPLQWEMNESQPWSTIRAGASAAATTSLCQCYQTCWWAPVLGPTSSWVMSSSTPIMWTDIYMTPGVIYCHYFLHPEAHMQ